MTFLFKCFVFISLHICISLFILFLSFMLWWVVLIQPSMPYEKSFFPQWDGDLRHG